VTGRLAILLTALAMVTVACSDVPHAEFEPPEGFVPFVADSNDNVGLGNDIAVDTDGVPYVSYFGFEAKLDEGEIPVARPVGAPFIPAVQVASVAEDGAWTLGAVAQAEEFPNVPVPFGPTHEQSLKSLEPDNANGTSIAVGEDGTRHVAFATNNGIWYAESSDTSTSTEQISKLGTTLNVAGAIGRPDIAVDGSTPWVAWTITRSGGQEVHVATPRGEGWRDEVVVRTVCQGDCPAPFSTGIAIDSAGPLIVYADTREAARSVMVARPQGQGWSVDTAVAGVDGSGLALDVDTEGTARVSYYTGDGTVEMGVSEGTSWNTTEVGSSGEIEPGKGNFAETTGITVNSEGTVYVTWYDAETNSVKLAHHADGAFEEDPTEGTEGGRYPSIAAGLDRRVYLAWYDHSTEDLLVGVLGDVGDLVLARPSPPPEGAVAPPPGTCEPEGTDLTIGALATTWDTPCLAVDAGADFTVTVENQSSVVHDFSIYPSADQVTEQDALFYSFADPVQPNDTKPYENIDPIEDAGDYFFRCDYHPTSMTGTFIVAGQGGGGQ
jgi:plastocyanin